jgi:hypothetical protein
MPRVRKFLMSQIFSFLTLNTVSRRSRSQSLVFDAGFLVLFAFRVLIASIFQNLTFSTLWTQFLFTTTKFFSLSLSSKKKQNQFSNKCDSQFPLQKTRCNFSSISQRCYTPCSCKLLTLQNKIQQFLKLTKITLGKFASEMSPMVVRFSIHSRINQRSTSKCSIHLDTSPTSPHYSNYSINLGRNGKQFKYVLHNTIRSYDPKFIISASKQIFLYFSYRLLKS